MTPDSLQWYPWKWAKWWADYRVQRLTWAEQGVYRALLDASWKDGGLPNDTTRLAEKARGPLPEFRQHWKAVRQFWQVREDGLLYNTSLEEIRAEQVARHTRLQEAGRKGGKHTQRQRVRSKAQASLSQAQAIEKSRVETTLKGGAAAVEAAPPAPNRLRAVGCCPHPQCQRADGTHTDLCPIGIAQRRGVA